MKEGLFILLVVAVLFALTAIRYRKQISALIGVAKVLKEAKDSAVIGSRPPASTSKQLVKCSQCGVWIPEAKALSRGGSSFCSDSCQKVNA